MRRRTKAAALCSGALLVGLVLPGAAHGGPPQSRPTADRPNLVVVMVDDMSAEIADYMSEVQLLADEGVSFTNYIVSNSLCCPSRATFLSGKYPHNSKVEGNYWPKGGFGRFLNNDIETNVAPYLSTAGYRTGLIGKYLNQYEPEGDTDGVNPPDYPPAYVPPGWDEWFSTGWGYQQFDYQAVDSVDGVTELVDHSGGDEADYFTDVMSARAGDFIDRAVEAPGADPFFLTLTPFAVHSAKEEEDPQQPAAPHFPPAPRDRADSPDRPGDWAEPEFESGDCGSSGDGGCDDVAFPDPTWGSFNEIMNDPPSWLPTEPLTADKIESFQQDHLERVQAAQAVNDLIGDVRGHLADAGVADDTYIIFTADNGFHLGEHALDAGKGTAYDHDVRVPLIVYPPGGAAARSRTKITQNTDLLPTLLELAGAELPDDLDGTSLVPLIEGDATGSWRKTAFISYDGFQTRPAADKVDPDRESGQDHAPPYVALRTKDSLYVDYSKLDDKTPKASKAEYFDLDDDPYMLVNLYRSLSDADRSALNDMALDYEACAGPDCWDLGLTAP